MYMFSHSALGQNHSGKEFSVISLSFLRTFSTVKRTSSSERVSPGGRRESYGDSKGNRNRTGSTSSSSSGKKNSER